MVYSAALELVDLCDGLVLLPLALETEVLLEGGVVLNVNVTVQTVQSSEDLPVNTVNNCLPFGLKLYVAEQLFIAYDAFSFPEDQEGPM